VVAVVFSPRDYGIGAVIMIVIFMLLILVIQLHSVMGADSTVL
jgi:hypothetical protein